jgi:hypothetical protein
MTEWPWHPDREPAPRRRTRRDPAPQPGRCPGPPHAGHASSDWTCPLDRQPGDPLSAEQVRYLPGTPETASERDRRLQRPGLRGANVDYPDVYRQACDAAVYAGIAEEALNLLGELDRHPGNRVLVMQRAAELRRALDSMEA